MQHEIPKYIIIIFLGYAADGTKPNYVTATVWRSKPRSKPHELWLCVLKIVLSN